LLEAARGLHAAGHVDRAGRLYLDYLEQCPDDAAALYCLGILSLQTGDLDQAAHSLGLALKHNGCLAEAALALGFAQLKRGDFPSALDAFDRAAALDPGDAHAHNGRGVALLALGRVDEALAAHRQAQAAQPDSPDALAGQGNALLALCRYGEAEAALRRALELGPGSPETANSLGATLKAQDRLDEACRMFQVALAARPDFPEALANLGSTQKEMGLALEARQTYLRAQALAPSPALALRLALLLPPLVSSRAQIDEVRLDLEKNLRQLAGSGQRLSDPHAEVGETAFYLAYHGRDDLPLQRAVARVYLDACPELACAAEHCRPAARRPGPGSGRIRLGLVSAYFCNHTISKLFGGLVARLDRRRFEVLLLRLPGPDDARGRELMRAADRAAFLPDSLDRARRMLAEAACDVLFYPDIGMHPLSYFLAFARLAPVQCVSFGHPVTTGIPNMDFFLSNRVMTPEHGGEGFSESLVRFSRLPVYYERPGPPARRYAPADFGLPDNRRIYLCPQSLFKFHPDFDAALAGILTRDPQALLVTIQGKHPLWEATLRRRFASAFDHDPGRIAFLPRMKPEDFVGALTVADAVLDTFHFGGGNTTLEALAQNVPVVTLPSALLRGRISLACYRQMGIAGPVAESAQEYVDMAVRLACDRDYREGFAREIDETKGALFEDALALAEFEDFFESAVREKAAP
jgi:predicted O-linked N-acetylglucosamine transferase (SPINDLY family)